MKAVLQDVRTGEVATYDVPQPELRSGGILVRTAFSAISSGTERATLETSEKSLVGKAMARPDLARQLLDFARTNGIRAAYDKVKARLDTLTSMGYSCSGVVMGVGDGVNEFQVGDRVACAGGGYASHCEVNWVPRNLVVRVPESVALDAASLTTIGAIALQGLRQSEVKFGETVVVIGAGLVGLLTMQLARAAGCRVIAVDRDASRAEKASSLAHLALVSSDPRLSLAVNDFSRYGADAAIVTAAAHSAEPLELAAQIVRDRGRIVVVGDVGMDVSRRNMYHKELSLSMSRSYGPGRYDPNYEEGGNDYPVGYVRWTERRNMEAFLDSLALRSIDVAPLLEKRYSINEAGRAYSDLKSSRAYTVILEYPNCAEIAKPVAAERRGLTARSPIHLRVGCIGAGGFARSSIFPNLKATDGVSLEAVATASGVTAESARRIFGFERTQTPSELLGDPQLDAVFIASRHRSHAPYVREALCRGKLVFVEKPLAVERSQLESVCRAYREAANTPFLMVGFNRRFAPATERMRRFFAGRQEPMLIHVRINAGFIPLDHWIQQPGEGGRIIGELCHFVDWARYMAGCSIRSISAAALPDGNRYNRDNAVVTLNFSDGSIANLLYLANGDARVPKEYFEIFCEGAIARLEDFELLQLVRNSKIERIKSARDKGHRRELQLILQAMIAGTEAPIPFDQIIEVTEATFAVAEAIATAQPVSLGEDQVSLALAGS